MKLCRCAILQKVLILKTLVYMGRLQFLYKLKINIEKLAILWMALATRCFIQTSDFRLCATGTFAFLDNKIKHWPGNNGMLLMNGKTH